MKKLFTTAMVLLAVTTQAHAASWKIGSKDQLGSQVIINAPRLEISGKSYGINDSSENEFFGSDGAIGFDKSRDLDGPALCRDLGYAGGTISSTTATNGPGVQLNANGSIAGVYPQMNNFEQIEVLICNVAAAVPVQAPGNRPNIHVGSPVPVVGQ